MEENPVPFWEKEMSGVGYNRASLVEAAQAGKINEADFKEASNLISKSLYPPQEPPFTGQDLARLKEIFKSADIDESEADLIASL
jgi:hypothetical protein